MAGATTADTNRVSLFFAEEGCWGIIPTPAPDLQEVKMTAESLAHQKETVLSEVIRTDRMRDTLAEVGVSADGDINFELATAVFDELFAGAFASEFSFNLPFNQNTLDGTTLSFTHVVTTGPDTIAITGGAYDWAGFRAGDVITVAGSTSNDGDYQILSINAALTTATVVGLISADVDPLIATETGLAGTTIVEDNSVTVTDAIITATNQIDTATFDLDFLQVGQWVRFSAMGDVANNNVLAKVLTVTTTTVVFEGTPLTNDAVDTATFNFKMLRTGTKLKSYVFEKQFGDITRFMNITGVRIGGFSLALESGSIATGTFTTIGKEGFSAAATIGDGTPTVAAAREPLNATANVGTVTEGGAAITTAIRSINMDYTNNLRAKPQVGSRSPVDVGLGFAELSGTVEFYFEDEIIFEKFLNHTTTSLSFRLTDIDNHVMIFTMPKVQYATGNPVTPGGNDDVILSTEFAATKDPITGTLLQLDLLDFI